ncbi:hypothetical protein [Aeromicrobium sp. CTD01-1L150]|uniref:hypothetical protein n=1 Tax=Aeromicrobium sp. CTD01-1L150 TaxID=3341830 RepID=UPI0035C19DA4
MSPTDAHPSGTQPRPGIHWTPAAEGALGAIGLLSLVSAARRVPYLTSGYDEWWRNVIYLGSDLVLVLAGAVAILSLLTRGATRVVAGVVALAGAGMQLVSLAVENIHWFARFADNIPGQVLASQLIGLVAGIGVAAVTAGLGLLLVLRHRD